MKAYRPSAHRDAEVSLEIKARRDGSKVHIGHRRPFNRNCCTKAKLSDDQIRWVRANWEDNGGTWTIAAMSKEIKVAKQTISQICYGHSWKEIK